MKSGKLRHRVTVQQKVVTRDAYGAEVVTWQEFATLWMSVEPLSGREYVAMRHSESDISTRFRCRYKAGLDTAMRLLFNGQAFDIREIINAEGINSELEIFGTAQTVPM